MRKASRKFSNLTCHGCRKGETGRQELFSSGNFSGRLIITARMKLQHNPRHWSLFSKHNWIYNHVWHFSFEGKWSPLKSFRYLIFFNAVVSLCWSINFHWNYNFDTLFSWMVIFRVLLIVKLLSLIDDENESRNYWYTFCVILWFHLCTFPVMMTLFFFFINLFKINNG